MFLAALLLTALLLPAGQDAESRATATYRRAMDLQAEGDAAGALTLLWEASGLSPGDAAIQHALGEALERVGALDAAIEAYRAAVAADPQLRKAANSLILALVKAGRGPEAVARARADLDAAPADPDRLFALGLAQSEGDYEAAIATFRRVLQTAPQHALARYNLALVLKRADRTREAVEELQRVVATHPRRPEAHYTLGVIHLQAGEHERAVAALRAAAAAHPAYAEAHSALGAALQGARDWRGAAEALRRAIALDPRMPGAHYTLGRVLRASGDPAGAARHFAEAERLRADAAREQEARTWTTVGAGRLEAGDLASAADLFRRAIAAMDTFAPAHFQLALALQRAGDADGARAAFARARELNPALVPPRTPTPD